jgi:hypothetical protein
MDKPPHAFVFCFFFIDLSQGAEPKTEWTMALGSATSVNKQ